MDSTRPKTSRIAKAFQKMIKLKTSSKNRSNKPGFCLLIPQEKLRCCEIRQFEKEEEDEVKEELKNRAAMEAFIAKLFAALSAVKAAYADLQIAQFPYCSEAIQSADQAVVDELKALSELKYSYSRKQIDSSPPHVTLMLAEIQEQQSLMKTYEITVKKMQAQIENRESQISLLQKQLQETVQYNRRLEMKLSASGSFSILDNIHFSDVNPKDFILVLHYALRSVRNFVKFMIREMESADWDIEAAVKSIHSDIMFSKTDHRAFAFESFVCREIFDGFNEPGFSIQNHDQPFKIGEIHQRRVYFFEQFTKLRSASAIHFLRQNPNSLLGKFLKSKYLRMVHPKMEFSFSGNLNQRKLVNSGDSPETEFFKAFAEMGKRVWLLHCLAFSFDHHVSIFQVKQSSKFSEVYMKSVTDDISAAADGGSLVAFTVVPGFKVGQTVVQSQVYLFPATLTQPKT